MTEPQYSLDEIRTNVSRIDNEILKLLAERRQLSLEVAKSKIQTAKPVRDQTREQELLLRLIETGQSLQLDAQYVTQIFHTIIEDSVLFQQAFLQKIANPESLQPVARVSFLGAKGSYSNLASRSYFSKKQTKLVEISCSTFRDVLHTVEIGNATTACCLSKTPVQALSTKSTTCSSTPACRLLERSTNPSSTAC